MSSKGLVQMWLQTTGGLARPAKPKQPEKLTAVGSQVEQPEREWRPYTTVYGGGGAARRCSSDAVANAAEPAVVVSGGSSARIKGARHVE